MKHIVYLIFYTLLINYVLACENNASFDLCMKTAKLASASCEGQDASCQCSIQKQMLACYSECKGDDKTFELESEQMKQIQSVCDLPNAELEETIQVNTTKQDNPDNNNNINANNNNIENNNNNIEKNNNNINSNESEKVYHMDGADFGKTHADEFIDHSQDTTSNAIINTTLNSFTVLILLFISFLFVA